VRPTRELGRAALDRPRGTADRTFLALLRVGFAQPLRSPGALVVSYTTVSPLPAPGERRAVGGLSLWHFPASRLGWVLPTTPLYGVRTFLGGQLGRPTRPPGRLVHRSG
jgi:hypothetical protein